MSRNEIVSVLAFLADCDGAVGHAQVPPSRRRAFEQALAESVVLFDERADCYVHPRAIPLAVGRYTMQGAA